MIFEILIAFPSLLLFSLKEISVLFPPFLILLAIESFFGWHSFRKNYQRTGRTDSRLMFAFRVLGIGQLLFSPSVFVAFVAFVVLSGGWGLWYLAWAPTLVFLNAFGAVLLFILSLLLYPRAKQWALKNPVDSNNQVVLKPTNLLASYRYAFVGIFIPTVLFFVFSGGFIFTHLFNVFLGELAAVTGTNIDRITNIPDEDRREQIYFALAKEKQDPSLCLFRSMSQRLQCYKDADPDFSEYEKTCAPYLRGDVYAVDDVQRECLFKNMYQQERSTEPADILDCDSIASQFGENQYINEVVKECRQIALIQKAIVQNDPKICDSILELEPVNERDWLRYKYAACLFHFKGTPTWEQGCSQYQDDYTYQELCNSETTPLPDSDLAPYWFPPAEM